MSKVLNFKDLVQHFKSQDDNTSLEMLNGMYRQFYKQFERQGLLYDVNEFFDLPQKMKIAPDLKTETQSPLDINKIVGKIAKEGTPEQLEFLMMAYREFVHALKECGILDSVKEKYPVILDLQSIKLEGSSPLTCAIKNNNYKIAQEFINYGMDIHARDRYKNIPLANAARGDDLNGVKWIFSVEKKHPKANLNEAFLLYSPRVRLMIRIYLHGGQYLESNQLDL